MNSSITSTVSSLTNYDIVAPISMIFAMIAVVISLLTLILVSLSKQLHTVTHLLTCNTCIASILYCIVQCNNYIYLLFIIWDTNDQSCRWRGYFEYMSIVAVVYSYLLQAISRFFIIVLSTKYRWLTTIKTHLYLIVLGWIVVIVVPLPALITPNISFRNGFLCWVPRSAMLHVAYTIIVYYLIPIILIIAIYIFIYVRIRYSVTNTAVQGGRRRQNRDLEVLRNIMILFGIYILGPVPVIFYMLTGVEFFYSMGIVSVSLTVTIEKFVSLFLDREIRNTLKKYFCCYTTRVAPMAVNNPNLPQ